MDDDAFDPANTQPETLYRDITERNVQDTPHVNLYIAGFPCQSYSRLNQKQYRFTNGEPFPRVTETINGKSPGHQYNASVC